MDTETHREKGDLTSLLTKIWEGTQVKKGGGELIRFLLFFKIMKIG
jgi:hypothetical protein